MSKRKLSSNFWFALIIIFILIGLIWQLIADNKDGIILERGNKNSELMADMEDNNDSSEAKLSDQGLEQAEVIENEVQQNADQKTTESEIIIYPVYLVGAVINPGIYEIENEIYLYQLIDLAGGMTKEAAADKINLATKIYGNQFVRIPTKQEWQADPEILFISGDIPERKVTEDDKTQKEQSTSSLVNINTADSALLETLPGIGPVTAQSIIDFRENNGKFARIEDIMQISGIKNSRFEQIKDLITV